MRLNFLPLFAVIYFAALPGVRAQELRIGYVGSLTGIAAAYGTSVQEGVLLARDELKAQGVEIDLPIDDDASETKNLVTAFQHMNGTKPLQALITGSWWGNALVGVVRPLGIPFLSCETRFDKASTYAPNYFIFGGDLKEWALVFEPLIEQKQWRRGAILRFASGFGQTLEEGMREMFSKPGREFAGALEYTSLDASDALSMIPRLRALNADVLYIDAAPSGLSTILKRMVEQGFGKQPVLTNIIADQMLKQRLYAPPAGFPLFASLRSEFDAAFAKRFEDRYQRPPSIDADLGYYALHAAVQALRSPQPLKTLKKDAQVNGHKLIFDNRNVFMNISQTLWRYDGGKLVPWAPQ